MSSEKITKILKDWQSETRLLESENSILYTVNDHVITVYTMYPGVFIGRQCRLITKYEKIFSEYGYDLNIKLLKGVTGLIARVE